MTKKTPRMRLKSVKTLPATMLAAERLDVSAGGPRRARRCAASAVLSPASPAASAMVHLYRSAAPCRYDRRPFGLGGTVDAIATHSRRGASGRTRLPPAGRGTAAAPA